MVLTKPRVVFYSLMLLLLLGDVVAHNDEELRPNNGGPRARDAENFDFAKHFQDHMVLQREPQKANVYGFSPDIGQKVTLKFTTPEKVYTYETTVKQGSGIGTWNFLLDPMPAKTAGDIKIESGGVSKNIKDVIFGDVWICSGQSNMEMTVSMINGGDEEIADAHNYPDIRVTTMAHAQSGVPLQDFTSLKQNWAIASNSSIGGAKWTVFSAVCWLYGKAIHKALDIPIGLVATVWGSTSIAPWSSPDALTKCGVPGADEADFERNTIEPINIVERELFLPPPAPQVNSVLWNAMVVPLIGMTIKGAIWYQGESDAGGDRMTRYSCTFPTMIDDWRAKFNRASNGQTAVNFPFGFVQLGTNGPDSTKIGGIPVIRFHQTADYGYVPNPDMKNVFMAVAMDLPGFDSKFGTIHPQEKKPIGERLALAGLAVAYNKSVMFQGPFPQKISLDSNEVTLDYGSTWELDVRDWYGFEVKCPNGTWLPSNIKSSTKTTITLSEIICQHWQSPIGLRYAWRKSPCKLKECSVYEKINQLPGPPFEYFPPTRK